MDGESKAAEYLFNSGNSLTTTYYSLSHPKLFDILTAFEERNFIEVCKKGVKWAFSSTPNSREPNCCDMTRFKPAQRLYVAALDPVVRTKTRDRHEPLTSHDASAHVDHEALSMTR